LSIRWCLPCGLLGLPLLPCQLSVALLLLLLLLLLLP
jgi:hypothetical protein